MFTAIHDYRRFIITPSSADTFIPLVVKADMFHWCIFWLVKKMYFCNIAGCDWIIKVRGKCSISNLHFASKRGRRHVEFAIILNIHINNVCLLIRSAGEAWESPVRFPLRLPPVAISICQLRWKTCAPPRALDWNIHEGNARKQRVRVLLFQTETILRATALLLNERASIRRSKRCVPTAGTNYTVPGVQINMLAEDVG